MCADFWTKKNKFVSYFLIIIMSSLFTFNNYMLFFCYYENLIYPDPTMDRAYFRVANFPSSFLPWRTTGYGELLLMFSCAVRIYYTPSYHWKKKRKGESNLLHYWQCHEVEVAPSSQFCFLFCYLKGLVREDDYLSLQSNFSSLRLDMCSCVAMGDIIVLTQYQNFWGK